jgi:FkbM family methyltransferase
MSTTTATPLNFCEAAAILNYFSPRTSPGIMIDVGAHFGSTFKPYLARGWRVITCEPDASKFQRLERFTDDPNFTFLRCAVGAAEDSSAAFFTSDESTGIASLIPFRSSHMLAGNVPVTTLATIIEQHDLRAIDFLKVDTEGFDYRVLQGFPWHRAELRPEVILCEFDEQKTRGVDYDYRSLGDLLLSLGYRVWLSEWHPIVRYGGNHRWRSIHSYPCALENADAWGNFIALRTGADATRMRRIIAAA